ncbi:MAG: DUF362 domain-containing protein [bacterium]|nr:DUF362 domain-containing protein [bacterium]
MNSLRSTVAVVEARPETVAEDYRRLLKLAGLAAASPDRRLVADGARPAGSRGIPVSPSRQLSAVLAGGQGCGPVFALDGSGRPAGTPAPWRDALAAAGTALADPAAWQLRRADAGGLRALTEALKDGPQLPRDLAGGPVLVTAGLGVGGGWPVLAGVELLARLVAPPRLRRRRCRATGAEVVAESLALVARECHIEGTVIDGVHWHVRAGRWKRRTLLGNILLAGRDPVAVDAVACRLAGVDPQRVPWLRFCAERGLGRIDPGRVDVVGRSDLLEPGLELPPRLLVPAGEGPWPGAGEGGGWWQRLRVRSAAPRASAWDGLEVASAAGRKEEP